MHFSIKDIFTGYFIFTSDWFLILYSSVEELLCSRQFISSQFLGFILLFPFSIVEGLLPASIKFLNFCLGFVFQLKVKEIELI